MSLGEAAAILVPIVTWDALWVQIVVIPFFNKGEDLHKDYDQSGALDAAISCVETKKIIPMLANMFCRVQQCQGSRPRKLSEEDVQELLNQVDYSDDLSDALEAMREANSMRAMLFSLQRNSDRIWKWGLCHMLAVLAIPAVCWMPRMYGIAGILTAIATATGTLVVAIVLVLRFHSKRAQFLKLLQHNKERTK